MARDKSQRDKGRKDRHDNNYDAEFDQSAEYASAEYPAGSGGYPDSAQYEAYDGYDGRDDSRVSISAGALVPRGDDSTYLPVAVPAGTTEPVLIRGSGVSMGDPFIRRRERPLTMRLAMLTLAACIVVSGLFAVTPLGTSAEGDVTSFQALAGAVVLHREISYHLYRAQWGDTIEGIATKQHVQIGGIYKLNNMLAGQEINTGTSYKIPDDPYFGKDYRPAPMMVQGNGSTRFGSDWWNAVAGNPLPEANCADFNGGTNPLGYHFVGPDPNSSWVRGFSYFHNGVDMAAPEGNPIRAAQSGQVIWAGYDATNGFGWSIVINHCYHLSTLYGHMDGVRVQIGQNVKAGQQIGIEGSTGWSTGPHLHFSVFWDNNWVDPMPYYGYNAYNITH
ncbi:MAG: LysM peptidoglycan-binding domain-containing M23 family metallopeptidase [Ktedonobacterales bacterium]